MTAAWYLAIMLQRSGVWTQKLERSESEGLCIKQAQNHWEKYWASGKTSDKDMQLLCYDDSYKQRIWIHCTKYGSCTIK
jgi:hypothetical protein